MPSKKILVIEIQQETNSFSTVPTTLKDFKDCYLVYGQDIVPLAKESKFQLGGVLKAISEAKKDKIEVVWVLCAWAQSGGPLTTEVYSHFKDVIADALKNHLDVAVIWLSLHGAMGVENRLDPEGELLEWLRNMIGNEVVIGVPLDLHANVTQKMVKHATFISAYRTNPHRDHFRVGYKSFNLLVDCVLGRVKPTMAFRKMKLLKGGGYGIDFLQPMYNIFKRMNVMERSKDVLSVSNFMVHIWLDEPEMGWGTVVVTNNNQALAEKLADELATMNWDVRHILHPQPDTPDIAIQKAKKAKLKRIMGAVIFCDTSDVVSAGAPGENTHLIKSIVEQAPELVAYTSIRDAEAVEALYDLENDSAISVTLGGKLETRFNQPYTFEGQLIRKYFSQITGRIVVLKKAGTHIVVSENPNPVMKPEFYRNVGLNLWKADLIVVKNLFPFRYHFILYNRLTINVISSGTTNIDVHQLDYKKLQRPIYPLDDIEHWQ